MGVKHDHLVDLDELDLYKTSEYLRLGIESSETLTEDESGIWWDRGAALLAITQSRRNGDQPLTTSLHAENTLIPTLDNLTPTKTENKLGKLLVSTDHCYHCRKDTTYRLAAGILVELLAVR